MWPRVQQFLIQKSKEAYWEITRAVGFAHIHGYNFGQIVDEFLGWILDHARRVHATVRRTALYLVYAPIAWALRRANVHFIYPPALQLERIGHFAIDIDSYLKERILTGTKVHPVLLCPPECRPNEALLAHWSRRLYVIRNPLAYRILSPLMNFPGLSSRMREFGMVSWQAWDHRYPFEARYGACPVYDIQRRWGDRAPLLQLSKAEIVRGEAELSSLGLPEGAWFVCVHIREGGYSPTDEWSHSFRNASISDYYEAMREIVRRGGWCIRVGGPTVPPMEPMPGVIDYARSTSRSDWMDIFLCAKCHFFLGTSSGLFCVAGVFGRPIALANMTSLSCAYIYFPNSLSIPKLVANAQRQILSWPELFEDQAADFRLTPEFADRGLHNVDNTPAEIAELAIEMMDTLENSLVEKPDDANLQARFRSLVKPRHYCWGAASRIGRAFLRRHKALLEA